MTSDWVFYCVLASLSPLILRFVAFLFGFTAIYDNLDMLYAGFGLNIAGLNIMSTGKVENRDQDLVRTSIVMLIIIVFCLACNYRSEHDHKEDYKLWKMIAFIAFTMVSLLISFLQNKSILKSVKRDTITN